MLKTIAGDLRMRGGIRIGAAAAVAALIALAMNGSAPAQQFPGVFTVNTTADGNDGACTATDCTLREAVALSTPGGGSSITLPPGVYRLTLGPLILQNSPVIFGAGLVRRPGRRRAHDGHRRAEQRAACSWPPPAPARSSPA